MKRTILGIGDVDFPEDWDEARIEAEVPKIRKRYNLNFAENNPLVKQTFDEAVKQGVNPHTMIRLFNQESGFDPKAKAKTSSARGVAQLIDKTARDLGVTDPHDPKQAIPAGVRYFKQNLERFEGDERKAIAAYHDGPTKVAATGLDVLSPAGADYLQRVYKPWANKPGQSTPAASGAPSLGGEAVGGPTPQATVTGRMKRPEEYTASVSERPKEDTGMGSSFLHGALGELYRQGRGMVEPTTLARSTPEQQAETQAYLDWKAQQNPWSGTAGAIAGNVPGAVGVGKAVNAVAPFLFKRALGPGTQAALGGAVGGAALNPGDVTERAGHAALEGGFGGVLTKALGKVAKPFKQRPEVEQFERATNPFPGDKLAEPPLSVGSASPFIRSVGTLTGHLPIGQKEAEARYFQRGIRELWRRATPPGEESMFDKFGLETAKRGDLFKATDRQIRDAYDQSLFPMRMDITPRDHQKWLGYGQGMDITASREYNAAMDQVLRRFAPVDRATTLSGKGWQYARDELQNRIDHFAGQDSTVGRQVSNALERVKGDLDNYGRQVMGEDWYAHHTGIDQAKATYKQLVNAVEMKGGTEGLNPNVSGQAMRKDIVQPGAISRFEALNQDLIEPMEALGRDASIYRNISPTDAPRRIYPMIASAHLGGQALGASGITVPAALGVLGSNIATGGSETARRLAYGKTGGQEKLAELVRKYPAYMGSIAGGQLSPSFRTRPLGIYDEEEQE